MTILHRQVTQVVLDHPRLSLVHPHVHRVSAQCVYLAFSSRNGSSALPAVEFSRSRGFLRCPIIADILARNIRIETDLIDQQSTRERLARPSYSLRCGKHDKPVRPFRQSLRRRYVVVRPLTKCQISEIAHGLGRRCSRCRSFSTDSVRVEDSFNQGPSFLLDLASENRIHHRRAVTPRQR